MYLLIFFQSILKSSEMMKDDNFQNYDLIDIILDFMIHRNEDVLHSTKVCDDYVRENDYRNIMKNHRP